MESARLELRVPAALKGLAERAANYQGQTVTAFVSQAVAERAREVVDHHTTLRLSNRDRKAFLAALESPPEPSDRLKQAFARHKKTGRK